MILRWSAVCIVLVLLCLSGSDAGRSSSTRRRTAAAAVNQTAAVPLLDGRFLHQRFNCSASAAPQLVYAMQAEAAWGRPGPYPVNVALLYLDNTTFCANKNTKPVCLQNYGNLTVSVAPAANRSDVLASRTFVPGPGNAESFPFLARAGQLYLITVDFPCATPGAQYPYIYSIAAIWQDATRAWIVALLVCAAIVALVLLVLLASYVYRKIYHRKVVGIQGYQPINDPDLP